MKQLFYSLALMTASSLATASFYDKSLTSITMNKLNYSGIDSDLEINKAFEEEPTYNTKEARFRSPHLKGFSIDVKALVDAEDTRDYYDAALNWGGISLAIESGSAKARTKSFLDNSDESNFVSAGDSLPTFCRSFIEESCTNRTMLQTGQDIDMKFDSERIQYTFGIKNGLYSFIGYEVSKINTPIILSREPSPDISNTSFQAGRDPLHTYENPEAWANLLDTQGTISSKGLIFGIDGREAQLIKAENNSRRLQHGFMGWFHIGVKSVEVSSSGTQEQYLNNTYGTTFETANNYEEIVYEQNAGIGYSAVAKIDHSGRMIFANVGVRIQSLFTSSDNTLFENSYSVNEFYGDFFRGVFAGVGITY